MPTPKYKVRVVLNVEVEAPHKFQADQKVIRMVMDGTLNESFQRDALIDTVEKMAVDENSSN